jgi:glucose-6-phosphate 1-dehydrogenase
MVIFGATGDLTRRKLLRRFIVWRNNASFPASLRFSARPANHTAMMNSEKR